MMTEQDRLVNSLVDTIQNHYPDMKVAGAPADMLENIQQRFAEVPPMLLALLAKCNGSFPYAFFPNSIELMDCELITAVHDMAQDNGFSVDVDEEEDEIDAKIQPIFYHHMRLPFATCNGDVDLLIDFAPSALGQKGQIIYQDAECGILKYIAPSFEAFLAQYEQKIHNQIIIKDDDELVFKAGETWF